MMKLLTWCLVAAVAALTWCQAPLAASPVTPQMILGKWDVVKVEWQNLTDVEQEQRNLSMKGAYYLFNADSSCIIRTPKKISAFTWDIITKDGESALYFAKAPGTKQVLIFEGQDTLRLIAHDKSASLTLERAMADKKANESKPDKEKDLIGAWKAVSIKSLVSGGEPDPLGAKAIDEGFFFAFYDYGLCILRQGNEAFDLTAFPWKLTQLNENTLLSLGDDSKYRYRLRFENQDSLSMVKEGGKDEVRFERQTGIWPGHGVVVVRDLK